MDSHHNSVTELSQQGGKRNKHLIFELDNMVFGIPLSQVKEIIGMANITAIPDAPGFFRGIINLRGQVISVIDLKTKLAVGKRDSSSKKPCIIICEFGDIMLGSIVDDVVEVHGFEECDIEHSVDIQSSVSREYITGVAKDKNRGLILLLDVGKVLNVQELETLRKHHKHHTNGNSTEA